MTNEKNYINVLDYLKMVYEELEATGDSDRFALNEEIYSLEQFMQEGSQGDYSGDLNRWLNGQDLDELILVKGEPTEEGPETYLDQEEDAAEQSEVKAESSDEKPKQPPAEESLSEDERLMHALKADLFDPLNAADDTLARADAILETWVEHAESAAEKKDFKEMRNRLLRELQGRVDDYLSQGEKRMKDSDWGAADHYFDLALVLDERNADAIGGKNRIQATRGQQKDKDNLAEILRLLGVREKIGELEDGIRQAEELASDGRLPDKMHNLLKSAREFFDKERNKHGEITTKMHMASMERVKEAVDELNSLLMKGVQEIRISANEVKPITTQLTEANALWESQSREALNYVLMLVDSNKHKPRIALRIIQDSYYDPDDKEIERPFHGQVKEQLNTTKREYEEIIATLDRAEKKLKDARKLDNPIESYRQVLEASELSSFLENMDYELVKSRQWALNHLLVLMNKELDQARSAKAILGYQDAIQHLDNIQGIIAGWPEEKQSEEIEEKLQDAEKLKQEVLKDQNEYNIFRKWVDRIRREKETSSNIKRILQEVEEKSQDEEFTRFDEFRSLVLELDLLREDDDKLKEAELAFNVLDWERTRLLCAEIIRKNSKSNIGKQALNMHSQADMELKVDEALKLIQKHELESAEKIITPLLKKHPELKERLRNEIASIESAKKATDEMADLYRKAMTEINKKGVSERVGALLLFRYIGGDEIERESGWPEFKPSFYTAKANASAEKLSQTLRKDILDDLKKEYDRRNDKTYRIDTQKLNV
ncbi:MAG: hypothetical protein JEZ06_15595, partial [Anaerolineaceae bacterium]|nr:hypothetical protein [Anaerolineaceae bacterium]